MRRFDWSKRFCARPPSDSEGDSPDRVRRLAAGTGYRWAAAVLGGALTSLIATSGAHAGPSSAPDGGATRRTGR
jgi:hypothetical protein